MSGSVGIVVLAAAFGAVMPATVFAQTQERSVYASVLDRAGAPVTGLTAADFMVREDGVSREIIRVLPASDSLRIAVLVDTSQAIRPHVGELRNALRAFFREVQGKHEVALFEFGDRPSRLADYTRDLTLLDAGVGRLFARPGSGAYVLDAIVEVSRGLHAREGSRPVIVVITGEGPEFSERYHETVLNELRQSDATLHAFVLDQRGAGFLDSAAREREFTLAKGTRLTGGRREVLLTSLALEGRLLDLAAELENQYQVVYARPGAMIPSNRIEVTVQQPRLKVRAPRVPLTLRAGW
jgi:VWFA-related protein